MKGNYNQEKGNNQDGPHNSISWRRDLGRLGEEYVANLLNEKGWQVIERNWHAGRYAEIDIIAFDPQRMLVFIEVKTRIKAGDSYGFDNAGFDKLDRRKKQKLLGCACLYMTQCKYSAIQLSQGYRFDAFVLYYPPLKINDLLHTNSNARTIEPKVQHIESFLP